MKWTFFLSIMSGVLLFSCQSPHYIGELRTIREPISESSLDSMDTDYFYVKKVEGKDTTIIYSTFLLYVNKEFGFHVYNPNHVILTFKNYTYSKTPRDTIYAEIEKTLNFIHLVIQSDTLSFSKALWIDSKEYPLIKDCRVSFDGAEAEISGDRGWMRVDLNAMTAVDDTGKPVRVHYSEKKK